MFDQFGLKVPPNIGGRDLRLFFLQFWSRIVHDVPFALGHHLLTPHRDASSFFSLEVKLHQLFNLGRFLGLDLSVGLSLLGKFFTSLTFFGWRLPS